MAARPASPSVTSLLSGAATSRSSKRPVNQPRPGGSGGTRSSCLHLPATTRFRASPSRATRTATPAGTRSSSYLTGYARRFELPVELDSPVRSIRTTNGAYLLDLDDRAYEADQVVVATGPFQVPFMPAIADGLDQEVVQLHSTAYRSPEGVPDAPVLVVGGGNTGFQIAEELSGSREIHLSIGSRQMPLPQRLLGRDLFWYLDASGLIRKTTASRIGRRMEGRDTLIGSSPRGLRRRHGVEIHGRAIRCCGKDGQLR